MKEKGRKEREWEKQGRKEGGFKRKMDGKKESVYHGEEEKQWMLERFGEGMVRQLSNEMRGWPNLPSQYAWTLDRGPYPELHT